ncbi:MAG: sugar ABC transporter permease [Erysipelotrichaceae bacterium]|nr:sugar ABC transporter permease [Erysipelotrichaceae bacterium]
MKPKNNESISLNRPHHSFSFGGKWSFILTFGLIAFLLYLFLCIAPLLTSLWYGFFRVSTGNLKGAQFVGYQNYITILKDKTFWMSFRNDVIIIAGKLLIILSFSVFFAVSMTKFGLKKWETGIYRFFLYLPGILSVVVITYYYQSFFDGNYGIFALLSGKPNQLISTHPIAIVTFIASWCGIGYFMIILISAINGIPASVYEAARLDGANQATQLFRITLPEIKDQIIYVVVSIISSSFAGNMNLTLPFFANRNENNMVMGAYVYHYANDYNELGYSNAAAVLLMIISFTVCYGLNRNLTKGDQAK